MTHGGSETGSRSGEFTRVNGAGVPPGVPGNRVTDGGAGTEVGVLALQGDYALHARALRALGRDVREVRTARDLDGLSGLILPGGESTAMLKLMEGTDMEDALARFSGNGGALFGTCAGIILLARSVAGPQQRSLGVLDVDVNRNGYGRQIDSFEIELDWTEDAHPVRGVFIRAPRITRTGSAVRVLSRREDEPVLVRAGRILAATFHPELTDDLRLHRYFLDTVMAAAAPAGAA
jgi:5'-phosphate synthase pdxT subunit